MIKFLSRVFVALLILSGIGYNASALQTDIISLNSEFQSSSPELSEDGGFHLNVYSSGDKADALLLSEETDEEEKNHLFEPSSTSESVDFQQNFLFKGDLGIHEASNKFLRSKPFLSLSPQKTYILFEVFRL